jgi:hypothetical protein
MDDQLVQGFNRYKRLPIEIIHIILKYLREPQDAKLLKDISHFYKTRINITNIFYNKWIIERQSNEGEDINWLENDLILYANEYAPTFVGMQPKFNKILSRFCNIKKTKTRYIFNIYAYSNKLSAKIRANILWGLFTIEERDEFIGTRVVKWGL